MPELRWTLLGLGILFCIGLWWRESRRPRQAADSTARAREPRQEALFVAPEPARRAPPEAPDTVPTTPIEELTSVPPATFPTVEVAQERLARELFSRPVAEMLERIEPILGDTEIIEADTPAVEPPSPPGEKIVTLRLAAPPLERFEGRALVDALRGAGLEHGKFSIFHKTNAAGATMFSVASLVEPGTFDLDRIEGQRFPGVSLFAVLPGPMEASSTLETMIATARELAERLQGVLQDERGAPLSAQRLADLRAGVVDWQRRADAAAS